jgi:hypothetical protein
MAVLGRNPRGRVGCRWLEAAIWVRGAVGRLRRSRGGVGEEWRREDEWSGVSVERAAQRQRGRGEKRREKVGVRAWGVTRGAGELTGGPRHSAGGGAADKRGWPISGRGESAGARGLAREETETGRSDAQ